MYVVEPLYGLCNKLRVIFSHRIVAKKENKEFKVIWKENPDCPGHFLDYFQAISDIEFIKDDNITVPIIKTFCRYKDITPDYTDLKLLPHIIKKINDKIILLGNDYTAVHIRRTDHINLAKSNNAYTEDKDFFNFLDISTNPIYI